MDAFPYLDRLAPDLDRWKWRFQGITVKPNHHRWWEVLFCREKGLAAGDDELSSEDRSLRVRVRHADQMGAVHLAIAEMRERSALLVPHPDHAARHQALTHVDNEGDRMFTEMRARRDAEFLPFPLVRESSEREMIAEFLRQEWAAQERYGALIREALAAHGESPELITDETLTDHLPSAARRRAVFGTYRGYGTDRPSYLGTFPDRGVVWDRVALTPDELLATRYIRYSFWEELSGGTRSPVVAAKRILANDLPRTLLYQEAREAFLALADRLRGGLEVPPLILVSADNGVTRVVLEGHARITGYALAPEVIPDPIVCLLGRSAAVAEWDEY
jgi:hypothetical protein